MKHSEVRTDDDSWQFSGIPRGLALLPSFFFEQSGCDEAYEEYFLIRSRPHLSLKTGEESRLFLEYLSAFKYNNEVTIK